MINNRNGQLPLFDISDDSIPKTIPRERKTSEERVRFSNYIVYVDESGDHSLKNIDDQYPIFVLAFCIFHKRHYSEAIVPALEKFKFNYFGHDQVVLHEHEIRKERGAFRIFSGRDDKDKFINKLTDIIEYSNFILVSCTIDKFAVDEQGERSANPYHIALRSCMEGLYEFLREKGQEELISHIVVECRGKKEDRELELEFRRICDGSNKFAVSLPFAVIFADKKVMSSGLQLADLVARPIGLNYLKPDQTNRAFDTLKKKFFCDGGREAAGKRYEGIGMKVYPKKRKTPVKLTEDLTPTGNSQST